MPVTVSTAPDTWIFTSNAAYPAKTVLPDGEYRLSGYTDIKELQLRLTQIEPEKVAKDCMLFGLNFDVRTVFYGFVTHEETMIRYPMVFGSTRAEVAEQLLKIHFDRMFLKPWEEADKHYLETILEAEQCSQSPPSQPLTTSPRRKKRG